MPKIESNQIDELEAKLRAGNHQAIRDFFRSTSRSDIPDRFVLRLAQIARRIDEAKKGLILLRDRVVDLPPGQMPNAPEQAEYAACLLKIGGSSEARRMLKEVRVSEAPEALKYLAFTYVHQWDYQAAVPLLKDYIAHPEVAPYERLIGSLNLSAALVSTEAYEEAKALLEQLIDRAKSEGHRLVVGNALELLAQVHIHTRSFEIANQLMEASWLELKDASPRYRYYLKKWLTIAALLRDPSEKQAISDLRRLRKEALKNSEWEIVRECDFYESLFLSNEEMFLHLYFGTPHVSYRKKMLEKSQGRISIPPNFSWGNRSAKRSLLIESGCDANGETVLKKGQAVHRLAMALSFDFYSPALVAQLFAQVFPQERFDPESSSHRIYELVRRLKDLVSNADMNLCIQPLDRGYKINPSESDVSLLLTRDRHAGFSVLESIESIFGASEFRLRDLSDNMKVPHTTLFREIKRLVGSRHLSVVGRGKDTRYRLETIHVAGSSGKAS